MGKLFGPQDELAEQKGKLLFEQANPFFGSMDLHELVRRVREGDSAKWQTTADEMAGVASSNEEAATAGQEMLHALESSWSGEGAESASQAIGSSIKVTQDAADLYQRNSNHFTSNSGQFEDIKNRLPNVPAKEPETGAWDSITPWDTDAEDTANKYKADVEAARTMYSGYEGNVHQAAYDMQGDFGQIKDLGGDFGSMERGGPGAVDDAGTGLVDIPGSGGGGDTGGPGGPGGPGDTGGSVPPGGGHQSPNAPSPNAPSLNTPPSPPNDDTGTSGYTPPSTVTPPAANHPPPNAPGNMPGNTGFGPNGGGPGSTGFGPTGAGPRGTPGVGGGPGGSSSGGSGGRFSAPGMGRAGGYSGGAGGGYAGAGAAGSGAAPGSGGGAQPGAGRMTGASPGGFGPTGSGGAGAAGGGSGGGAAGGRGGMMGGMGGAGRGGQGGGDEEHQRKYLADTDEAFALTDDGEVLRDPVTGHVVTPPTIGE